MTRLRPNIFPMEANKDVARCVLVGHRSSLLMMRCAEHQHRARGAICRTVGEVPEEEQIREYERMLRDIP